MKKLLTLGLPLAIACTMYSCRKDNSTTTSVPKPTPNPNTTTASIAKLDAVYNSLNVASTKVTLDAAMGGVFRGPGGSQFVFSPSSFKYADGNQVTGNVNIEVTDVTRKTDMLFSGMLTISDGEPIVSGGEFYITAKQNGQEIFLKDGQSYQVNVVRFGTDDKNMVLFKGEPKNSVTDKVNWKLAPVDSNVKAVIYKPDTLTFFPRFLYYCNADAFLTNPDYQSFSVLVSGIDLSAPDVVIRAYTFYDNYRGIWSMTNIANGIITENHVPNIPVHFAIIASTGGDIYYGTLGVTPKNGTDYTVTLKKGEGSDVKAAFDAL